jgi:hypothetical protein
MRKLASYQVAAFGSDGSLVGTGTWERAVLSPKWLTIATELVDAASRTGRAALPIEHLTHLTLHLTCASGAMLATYRAHGVLACSALLLTGEAPQVESGLVRMFVESLRRAAPVARAGAAEPFAAMYSLIERPLHIVVPWTAAAISDDDHGLIQELSTHVAGAVLTRSE